MYAALQEEEELMKLITNDELMFKLEANYWQFWLKMQVHESTYKKKKPTTSS